MLVLRLFLVPYQASRQIQLAHVLAELLLQCDGVEVGVAQLHIRVAGGARQHPTEVQGDLSRTVLGFLGEAGSRKLEKHQNTKYTRTPQTYKTRKKLGTLGIFDKWNQV